MNDPRKERLLTEGDQNEAYSSMDKINVKRRVSASNRRRSSKKKPQDDERSMSRTSSMAELQSVLEAQMNKYQVKEEYRDIKMREIMSMYDPKWMAIVGILASFVTSFSLPMFGFVLS